MVVRRLETFAESINGGMVSVNLKDMIERELLTTGRRPTVVLDASGVFRAFEDEDNCFYYNGQPSISKMKVENFVKKIISCGANLIVILRGGLDKCITAFAEDKFNYLNKVDLILKADTIKAGTIKPISEKCIKRTFALISNKHYQVFTAIKKTHVEVANVAIREQCLAVIGQDSNYLIYDGLNNYISVKTLNVETLDCKIYDRKTVMEYLGLDSFQMPMFATLCGNDIVPIHFLKNFHAKISKFSEIQNRTILLHIAKEVRHGNRIIQNGNNDPYKLVKYFVDLIGNSQIKENVITKSLNMYLKYEENEYDNEQLKFLINEVANCKLDILPLKIIINREINSKLFSGIVDRTLTSYLLFRPLRRKVYGVLIPKVSLNLFHELDTVIHEYFMEEMLMHKFQQKTSVTVTPLVPHCKNPGLKELLSNRSPEMNVLRYNLFFTCISETLNFSVVRLLHEKLVFPVLALRYLATEVRSYFPDKVVFRSESELQAILIAVIIVAGFPQERLKNIEDTEPNLWMLQLTTLFLEAGFILNLLNEACGFVITREKSCICNFYDGKLINSIHDKMRRGANCDYFFEGNAALEALFYTLLGIILE